MSSDAPKEQGAVHGRLWRGQRAAAMLAAIQSHHGLPGRRRFNLYPGFVFDQTRHFFKRSLFYFIGTLFSMSMLSWSSSSQPRSPKP